MLYRDILTATAKLKETYDKVLHMKIYRQFIIHHEGNEIRLSEETIQLLLNTNTLDKAHLMNKGVCTHPSVQKLLDMK
jgi:hypothetical protein